MVAAMLTRGPTAHELMAHDELARDPSSFVELLSGGGAETTAAAADDDDDGSDPSPPSPSARRRRALAPLAPLPRAPFDSDAARAAIEAGQPIVLTGSGFVRAAIEARVNGSSSQWREERNRRLVAFSFDTARESPSV